MADDLGAHSSLGASADISRPAQEAALPLAGHQHRRSETSVLRRETCWA